MGNLLQRIARLPDRLLALFFKLGGSLLQLGDLLLDVPVGIAYDRDLFFSSSSREARNSPSVC
ncbi:hypothetical protein ACFSQ7_49560 [Paenibacillus rhizoplanae]